MGAAMTQQQALGNREFLDNLPHFLDLYRVRDKFGPNGYRYVLVRTGTLLEWWFDTEKEARAWASPPKKQR